MISSKSPIDKFDREPSHLIERLQIQYRSFQIKINFQNGED